MRIHPYLYGSVVLVIFLGTIFGFKAAGIWSISGKITASGEAVQPLAGDVDTIKGWMTLEQIASTYHVPLADFLANFNLPADTPATTAIKHLESEDFSVTNLRDWLQNQAAPVQTEVTAIASPATPTPTVVPSSLETSLLPTEHIVPDKTITGETTFQDLLDWGLTEQTIRQIIGGELPALSVVVKDFITQQGIQFATVKTALQTEVDKTK